MLTGVLGQALTCAYLAVERAEVGPFAAMSLEQEVAELSTIF